MGNEENRVREKTSMERAEFGGRVNRKRVEWENRQAGREKKEYDSVTDPREGKGVHFGLLLLHVTDHFNC